MPSGQSSLPTKSDEEFKPFVRRLPEFKFWHSATRAICIAFACSWSDIFNLPVFWPVLVVYWLILVFLTMRRQIQSMIKYRYVFLGIMPPSQRLLGGKIADSRCIDTCHGTLERPSTRAPQSKVALLCYLIQLAASEAGGWRVILFDEHFSMVVMSGRNLHLIRYMPKTRQSQQDNETSSLAKVNSRYGVDASCFHWKAS